MGKYIFDEREPSPPCGLSRRRRWFIYSVGLAETLLFSGCIFGWAQLVYVLKNEGIFSELCLNGTNSMDNSTESGYIEEFSFQGCNEQDKRFALIYTISCLVYGAPSVLVGYMLHYLGLAVSRLMAASLLSLGFVALGYTTPENSYWLYVAMTMISLGGNQLRLAGFQFCNLFPEYRSTALTFISGSFAASAGLFMFLQIGQSSGFSLLSMSLCLAGISFLSIPATFFMPKYHVSEDMPVTSVQHSSMKDVEIPFSDSFFSLSGFTHMFWQLVNLTAATFVGTFYNSWISGIAKTKEEAGLYSVLYSISALFCPLISPLPGLLADYLSKRRDSPCQDERTKFYNELQSPILPMMIVILLCFITQLCLFFHHYAAIYVILFGVVALRSSVISVGNAFLRIRFPPSHFDRIVGTYGTITSILNVFQYLLFLWAKSDLFTAITFYIGLIALTLVHPLHLLSKSYLNKISRNRFLTSEEEKLNLKI